MSAVTRRQGTSTAALVAVMLLVVAAAGVALLWTIARWIETGTVEFVNPMLALMERQSWTAAHTTAAVAVGVVVAIIAAAAISVAIVSGRDRTEADRAAQYMGRGKEISELLPRRIAEKHRRFGFDPKTHQGVRLGRSVVGGMLLHGSFEDTVTVLAGPGRDKSVSIVVPNILLAPGPVLATSVKPDDLLGPTLNHRATLGTVHVFDPQRLGGASEYESWWNPLRGLATPEQAQQLAEVLAVASYGTTDFGEPFFPTHGKNVVADYLLAAAVSGHYLPDVYEWLNVELDPTPAMLVEARFPQVAQRIRANQARNEKTRSGVYGWAQAVFGFMASAQIRESVVPTSGRRELVQEEIVAADADTIYLFSAEGQGSAGPLVAALTQAVLNAAEERANRAGGRLPSPLLAILDEAANICRIPNLPSKYTYYRSMSIVPVTILQSEPQGIKVWGREGFNTLWEASMVQVFGGGNASNDFLRNLSERIGDYEYRETSTSYRGGERSTSTSRRSERIMDVADLNALRRGRMVIFASGCRPTLVRSTPWFRDKRLKRLAETPAPERATNVEPDPGDDELGGEGTR